MDINIAEYVTLRRVGSLGGHEPHISDLRTPLFVKLTSEPHINGSEPHISKNMNYFTLKT